VNRKPRRECDHFIEFLIMESSSIALAKTVEEVVSRLGHSSPAVERLVISIHAKFGESGSK